MMTSCRALLVAGTLAAGSAHAQVSRADSAALTNRTQQLMDAITSGDTTLWAASLLPRWMLTDEEGQHLGRSEFLSGMRGLPSGQHGSLRCENYRLVGARGVTVLSYDIAEWHDYYGQELRTRFHATDTWVREPGGWKLLASQMIALPTPIAGRVVARPTLDEYVGTYRVAPGIELRIQADDSGLSVVRGEQPPLRLYALDDRIFIRHGVRGFWLFERDGRGAVVRLVNWRDNNAVVWQRSGAP